MSEDDGALRACRSDFRSPLGRRHRCPSENTWGSTAGSSLDFALDFASERAGKLHKYLNGSLPKLLKMIDALQVGVPKLRGKMQYDEGHYPLLLLGSTCDTYRMVGIPPPEDEEEQNTLITNAITAFHYVAVKIER